MWCVLLEYDHNIGVVRHVPVAAAAVVATIVSQLFVLPTFACMVACSWLAVWEETWSPSFGVPLSMAGETPS